MPIPSTFRQIGYSTDVPSDVFLPKGIEAVLEYNGLVLNDRRRLDRYVVQRITGLGDPELRDSREANPDRDGETASKALYSGRTITLQGYMEAGNLRMLRYLSQQLKKAFDKLEEQPLRFYFDDWLETWPSDALAANEYQILDGVGSFAIANGQIDVGDTTVKRLLLQNGKTYKDFQMTMEFTPRVNTNSTSWEVLGIGRYIDSDNYLMGGMTSLDGLTIAAVTGGTTAWKLSAAPPAVVLDRVSWVRWTCIGNFNLMEFFPYDQNPATGGKPSAATEWTISGADATNFGSVNGKVGLRVKASHADWSFGDYEVATYPGDQQIVCRKVAALEGDEEQANDRFRRPFLVSLRASSDLQVSKSVMHLSGYIGLAELDFPAGGIPFDANGSILFGEPHGVAYNYGSAPARPKIRFRRWLGTIINPAVVNMTNGSRVVFDGTTNAEWIDIDCDARTVVDDQGRNMYHLLSPQTTWLTLEPGANAIASGAESNEFSQAGGDLELRWRHSTR